MQIDRLNKEYDNAKIALVEIYRKKFEPYGTWIFANNILTTYFNNIPQDIINILKQYVKPEFVYHHAMNNIIYCFICGETHVEYLCIEARKHKFCNFICKNCRIEFVVMPYNEFLYSIDEYHHI